MKTNPCGFPIFLEEWTEANARSGIFSKMNNFKYLSISSLLICLVFIFTASGQTRNNQFRERENAPSPNVGELWRTMNLSPAQLGKIRAINREYQPLLRGAREKMQAANRALDEAVYSGQGNVEEVQIKLREAQTAHSEWLKVRTDKEFALSTILDKVQLARFRELRSENERIRQRNVQRRLNNRQTPASPSRLGGLPRQIRNRRLP